MNKLNLYYAINSKIPSRINLIATAPINNPIILDIACEPSLPKNFNRPEPRRIANQHIETEKIITKNFKKNPDITRT